MIALASKDSNTGSSSPGELEMTCSTSEVAVCCSSASVSSLSRASTRACRSREVADRVRVERLAAALMRRGFLAVLPALRVGRFMSAPNLRSKHRSCSKWQSERG